jgi:hypothetical protein
MSRIDLWRWSATRVEIDHRAREARLRLEHLERLLIMRALPTGSWVSRILFRREGRFFSGASYTAWALRRDERVGPRDEGCDRRHGAHRRAVSDVGLPVSTPAQPAERPGPRWTAGGGAPDGRRAAAGRHPRARRGCALRVILARRRAAARAR